MKSLGGKRFGAADTRITATLQIPDHMKLDSTRTSEAGQPTAPKALPRKGTLQRLNSMLGRDMASPSDGRTQADELRDLLEGDAAAGCVARPPATTRLHE